MKYRGDGNKGLPWQPRRTHSIDVAVDSKFTAQLTIQALRHTEAPSLPLDTTINLLSPYCLIDVTNVSTHAYKIVVPTDMRLLWDPFVKFGSGTFTNMFVNSDDRYKQYTVSLPLNQ